MIETPSEMPTLGQVQLHWTRDEAEPLVFLGATTLTVCVAVSRSERENNSGKSLENLIKAKVKQQVMSRFVELEMAGS
jgi:hypothetical protein